MGRRLERWLWRRLCRYHKLGDGRTALVAPDGSVWLREWEPSSDQIAAARLASRRGVTLPSQHVPTPRPAPQHRRRQ